MWHDMPQATLRHVCIPKCSMACLGARARAHTYLTLNSRNAQRQEEGEEGGEGASGGGKSKARLMSGKEGKIRKQVVRSNILVIVIQYYEIKTTQNYIDLNEHCN